VTTLRLRESGRTRWLERLLGEPPSVARKPRRLRSLRAAPAPAEVTPAAHEEIRRLRSVRAALAQAEVEPMRAAPLCTKPRGSITRSSMEELVLSRRATAGASRPELPRTSRLHTRSTMEELVLSRRSDSGSVRAGAPSHEPCPYQSKAARRAASHADPRPPCLCEVKVRLHLVTHVTAMSRAHLCITSHVVCGTFRLGPSLVITAVN
jgi:hypothetical protein